MQNFEKPQIFGQNIKCSQRADRRSPSCLRRVSRMGRLRHGREEMCAKFALKIPFENFAWTRVECARAATIKLTSTAHTSLRLTLSLLIAQAICLSCLATWIS